MNETNRDTPSGQDPRQSPDEAARALSALRRFVRPRASVERCELCSAAIDPVHQHLLDRHSRQIACACDACSILFCGHEAGTFLRIPRRVRRLDAFSFTDLEWEALMLPINLAFFLRDAQGKPIALYPSPAGAVESQIDLFALQQNEAKHKLLLTLEPEVEAILVNRVADVRASFLVPLDECYRLVGLVKTKWRGLSGGPDVWAAIHQFLSELDAKTAQVTHA